MQETSKKRRFIKTVNITYSDVKNNLVDTILNRVLNTIYENGGNFISSYTTNIGVGVSPVFLVYNIIYEATNQIDDAAFTKGKIYSWLKPDDLTGKK